MFPLYKDRGTVKKMIERSCKVLNKIKIKNEIVIVDDGCPERSGHYAKNYQKSLKMLELYFIKKFRLWAAIKTTKNCKHEWIFQTDGDAEYDVNDLFKLLKKTRSSDLVVTFRLKKNIALAEL